MSETRKVIIGHFVATDGEWPENLGVLDDQISVVDYQEDGNQLLWYPDGIVAERRETPTSDDDRVLDLAGCARCHGGPHPGLIFRRLTHPVGVHDLGPLEYWASCPTTGEPILMSYREELPPERR